MQWAARQLAKGSDARYYLQYWHGADCWALANHSDTYRTKYVKIPTAIGEALRDVWAKGKHGDFIRNKTLRSIVDAVGGLPAGLQEWAAEEYRLKTFREEQNRRASWTERANRLADEFMDAVRRSHYVDDMSLVLRLLGLAPDEPPANEQPEAPPHQYVGFPDAVIVSREGGGLEPLAEYCQRTGANPDKVRNLLRRGAKAGRKIDGYWYVQQE